MNRRTNPEEMQTAYSSAQDPYRMLASDILEDLDSPRCDKVGCPCQDVSFGADVRTEDLDFEYDGE